MENLENLPATSALDPKTESTLQILIAEHAALQSARSAAVADGNSRVTAFLLAVVGCVIALGFVAGISGAENQSASTAAPKASPTPAPVVPVQMPPATTGFGSPTPSPTATVAASSAPSAGAPFFWFALVLLPSLLFLGWVTFKRALQTAMEDVLNARGMNRIRHFYAETAPLAADYFVHSIYDDTLSVLPDAAFARSRFQPLITTAGTVLVVNAILFGALIALAAQFFVAPPAWLTAILGAFVFAVAVAAQHFYQSRAWEDFESHLTPRFPAPAENPR